MKNFKHIVSTSALALGLLVGCDGSTVSTTPATTDTASTDTSTDGGTDVVVVPDSCETQEPGTICTAAGNGIAGLGSDGSDPSKVSLYLPQDVTPADDGKLYIIDWNNHRIRVSDKGVVSTLLGTGYLGDAPDGTALEVSLNHPTHVAFSPDGKLIVSAWHNSKLLELDPATGAVKGICGTGGRGFGGDGKEAAKAVLDLPVAVDFDSSGRLVVSDQANQRVRRIEDGNITTIVGPPADYVKPGWEAVVPAVGDKKFCKAPVDPANPTPEESRLADGAVNEKCLGFPHFPNGFEANGDDAPHPASGYAADGKTPNAFLNQSSGQQGAPTGRLEIGPDDTIYIADTLNCRIRAVTKDGNISTFAGSGPAKFDATFAGGYSGDGAEATKALLNGPTDIAVADNGTVFIADTRNSCVRVVKDGIIDTFAGKCGEKKFGGDGGRATDGHLNRPYGVALDKDGNLYIADTHNHRIRVVYGAVQ